MAKDNFPTGLVVGMTQLPYGTIKRYVSLFPDHFSPTAKQPTRGRRFTPKDIDLLLGIRELYNQGRTTIDIQQTLAGNWQISAPARPEVRDATKIIQEANSLLEATRAFVKRGQRDLENAGQDYDILAKAVMDIEDRLTKIETKRLKTDRNFIQRIIYIFFPEDEL